jgi:hypothetical protein
MDPKDETEYQQYTTVSPVLIICIEKYLSNMISQYVIEKR